MESRLKLAGHPIHPMLIVLPLGLFAIAVLFDVIYLATGETTFAEVAFWNISAGIVGGLLAAVFGFIDWLAIPQDTRAKRIGAWHGGGNVVIVLLFILSWFLRLDDHAYAPNLLPFVLGLVAVIAALVTAWLGGEMVYRLRVAVDDDAGLNASNSLSRDGLVSTSRSRRHGKRAHLRGVDPMCLTCGCMDAHLEMGEANITYEDVKRAADENGRSVAETLDIMERTKAKDREQHPNEYSSAKA